MDPRYAMQHRSLYISWTISSLTISIVKSFLRIFIKLRWLKMVLPSKVFYIQVESPWFYIGSRHISRNTFLLSADRGRPQWPSGEPSRVSQKLQDWKKNMNHFFSIVILPVCRIPCYQASPELKNVTRKWKMTWLTKDNS